MTEMSQREKKTDVQYTFQQGFEPDLHRTYGVHHAFFAPHLGRFQLRVIPSRVQTRCRFDPWHPHGGSSEQGFFERRFVELTPRLRECEAESGVDGLRQQIRVRLSKYYSRALSSCTVFSDSWPGNALFHKMRWNRVLIMKITANENDTNDMLQTFR